jgi:hypothetical protein
MERAKALGARIVMMIIATVTVAAIPCGKYLLRLANCLTRERTRCFRAILMTDSVKLTYLTFLL